MLSELSVPIQAPAPFTVYTSAATVATALILLNGSASKLCALFFVFFRPEKCDSRHVQTVVHGPHVAETSCEFNSAQNHKLT